MPSCETVLILLALPPFRSSAALTCQSACPRLAACCRCCAGSCSWPLHSPALWGRCDGSLRGQPPASHHPVGRESQGQHVAAAAADTGSGTAVQCSFQNAARRLRLMHTATSMQEHQQQICTAMHGVSQANPCICMQSQPPARIARGIFNTRRQPPCNP
jgi:hypothetical protein